MKENADKARALGEPELAKKLTEDAEQMFRLRFQLSMGQADGLKKLRSLRKERARMLTVQRQRELDKAAAAPAAEASQPVKKMASKKTAAAKAPAAKKTVAKNAPVAAAGKIANAAKKTAEAAKKTAKTAKKEQ